jgi:hypothetical protein
MEEGSVPESWSASSAPPWLQVVITSTMARMSRVGHRQSKTYRGFAFSMTSFNYFMPFLGLVYIIILNAILRGRNYAPIEFTEMDQIRHLLCLVYRLPAGDVLIKLLKYNVLIPC